MPKLSVRFPGALMPALDQRVRLEGSDRSKVIHAAVCSYLGIGADSQPDFDDHERRIARLEQMANID